MKKRLLYITFISLCFGSVLAQETKKDSTLIEEVPLKYYFDNAMDGGLYLKNPTEKETYYDPKIKRYVVREKIGQSSFSTPQYLTEKEYQKYKLQQDIRDYFKAKNDAISGKKTSEEAQKDLLPTLYVNNKFFETLFGGSEIKLTPRGSITLNMGLLYQNIENPLLSEENRKSYTPQFDQQMRASLTAKIGERLTAEINFDSESTFNFQNQVNIEYTANEDDIIQKLEAGNITMDINNSLIQGSQSLFGFKTQLQFGKTKITGVFSQQQSQTKNITAQGGSALTEFELRTTQYDNNRHFFLAQYFRNNYNNALSNLPLINTGIQITKVEVWVTNRNTNTEDVRNVVGLVDLGESGEGVYDGEENISNLSLVNVDGGISNPQFLPRNDINSLSGFVGTNVTSLRTISGATSQLSSFQAGEDYSIIENARKLDANEYTFHPQLGYITLRNRLNDIDVLAVAFEYTLNGEVYRVGELSTDGISSEENLVVKLLRSEIINTQKPMWRLMMKNIYSLGAYQLERDGFKFNLLFRDDVTGQAANNLLRSKDENIQKRTILNITNLDRLDPNNNRTRQIGVDATNETVYKGDGFFDYLEGLTVDTQNGTIIFPSIEPFGRDLDVILSDAEDKNLYVFNDLYTTTAAIAENEFQNKDKYLLSGFYRASGDNGISLGAFNVPRGSVTVTAGGIVLTEGVDYTVDYLGGRVKIINPAIEASGQAVNVSLENNTFFNQQQKTFIGFDLEHQFSKDFIVGATYLNLREQPLTNKVQFGQDPVNNSIYGLNANFSTETPFLTAMVNHLPNIDTDAPSKISVRGDFAYLKPNTPDAIDIGGEATTYIDDFEGAQIPINLGTPSSWSLASVPIIKGEDFGIGDGKIDAKKIDTITSGFNRAKLSWYTMDQLFLPGSSLRPGNLDPSDMSRPSSRAVQNEELFPNRNLDITQRQNIQTFDLTYYPNERGPYNYAPLKAAPSPAEEFDNTVNEEKWAGITRGLTTTDFQRSNIQYVEFWLQDPYEHYDINDAEAIGAPNIPTNEPGILYINLGSISEDILKDGRKSFENGLPVDGNQVDGVNVEETQLGNISTQKSLLYAFEQSDAARQNQDVGLDGYANTNEGEYVTRIGKPEFRNLTDPSFDNYQFFRGASLDAEDASILRRYKNFNNPEGNSPTPGLSPESFPTSATNNPDVEDVNRDQTMNTIDAYWYYKIDLSQNNLNINNRHIVDQRTTTVRLEDETEKEFTWYLFRVPIDDYEDKIGTPSLQSVRFMRMFLTDFKIPVNLRIAELQLVRGDWRIFDKLIDENNQAVEKPEGNPNNVIETGVVNVEENENRVPINYVLPPTITRESLQGTSNVLQQNEQSLSLRVRDVEPGNTLGVFKNVNVDLRMFKRLKMFMHLEEFDLNTVNDNDLVAVIRLGSDTDDNYYQVEIPLTKTTVSNLNTSNALNSDAVWPEINNLDIALRDLTKIKIERDSKTGSDAVPKTSVYVSSNNPNYKIKGSPNLSNIRTVFLGVKNASTNDKSAEVWFNELRLAGFDNDGGWATKIAADATIADFANISVNGGFQSIGFGGIDQSVNERSQEEIKNYSLNTSINAGQLLPKTWNLKIPVNYSISEEIRTPKFDPQYEDVLSEDAKDINPNSDHIDTKTKHRSINLVNVRKEYNPEKEDIKPRIYDIENFSVSYAYSDNDTKSYTVEKDLQQKVNASATYAFNFKQIPVTPFKNVKVLNNRYLKILGDFNFNLLPTSIGVNSRVDRTFSQFKTREILLQDNSSNIAIPTLTQRNFLFNWDYNINYQLSKALNVSFNAANHHVYDAFESADISEEELEKITLYSNFFEMGRANNYSHTITGNYKLPIDKLPFLKFLTSNYSYTGTFNWQAAGPDFVEQIGNTIQNSAAHTFNTNLNFSKLYNEIGLKKLFKSKTNKLPGGGRMGGVKNKKTFKDHIYTLLTTVKTAKFSYTHNLSTLLNGYAPSVGFLGRDQFNGGFSPGLGFVFGDQKSILNQAAANQWLTVSTDGNTYNKNFNQTDFRTINYNVSLKPIADLDIQLTGNRNFTKNTTRQFDYVPVFNEQNERIGEELSPGVTNESGNFSISYSLIRTAFADPVATFNEFKENREIFRNKIHSDTYQQELNNATTPEQIAQVENQSLNSQQVLINSFLSAYSGSDAGGFDTTIFKKIPIPNWKVNYRGLMKIDWFKDHFSNFLLSHGYDSSYTINNYTNNLGSDTTNTFQSPDNARLLYGGVTLVDNFNPLVRIDMKFKNSLSFRATMNKSRSLSLNLNNTTLSENTGSEFAFGIGYIFKDVTIRPKFNRKRRTLKGDINVKADVSYRTDENVVRSVDSDTNQIVGGQNLLGIKVAADYNLSRNFTASLYYDQNVNTYAISTLFPRQNINAGISLVYNLR